MVLTLVASGGIMPQTAQVNSSHSSPFLVSFLQAVLSDHPPQSAFALLRTLYDIAKSLPRRAQGTQHAVLLLEESVLSSDLCLKALVSTLRSRGETYQASKVNSAATAKNQSSPLDQTYKKFLSSTLRLACKLTPPVRLEAKSRQ